MTGEWKDAAAVKTATEKKIKFVPMSSVMHQKAILANTAVMLKTPGAAQLGLFS